MPPAEPAAYVILLAEKTGWTENFILWELPISRANFYIHAILVSNGIRTAPSEVSLRRLLQEIA